MKLLPPFFRTFAVASLVVLASLIAGCSDSPSAPSSSAPFTTSDLVLGTGDEAVSGKALTVNYSGWLYDRTAPEFKGLLFDTSAERGAFTFTLGAGQVIQGWEQGLVGMKVGGTRRLVIPPSLAYGKTRTSAIPPDATLVFEVQLLSVQ